MGSTKLAKPRKSKNRVGINDKDEVNIRIEINDDEIGNNKIGNNEIVKKKNYQKTSKFKKMISSFILAFFTFRARLAFIILR